MSSLREIDGDLDQITVDSARLAEVQKGVAARGKLALAAADAELAALANGTVPLTRAPIAVRAEPPVEDDGPPSGQIDVPDDVLKSSELPAVLALPDDAPYPEPASSPEPSAPLSLDLDSGETPLEDAGPEDLTPIPTSASTVLPVEAAYDPPTETRALDTGADDPNADLASLLGDSDPMREEGAAPIAPTEIEPEPTEMFTAADAERYSRPAPPLDEQDETGDLELEIDEEIIEIEEEEAEPAAARPRTAPPPPPRTGPPPPPGQRASEAPPRGFLGKLLQRKP